MRERNSEHSSAVEMNAVFAAGEMAGVAMRLNPDHLEKFLDSLPPDTDFRYADMCRAAIVFRRTIFKEVGGG